MPELDAVASITGAGFRRADDLRRGIEQFEDTLARRHRGLQDVVLVAQVLDWTPEALRVHVEAGQHADSDGAREHAESAAPDDQGDRNRGKKFNRGVVKGVREDRVFERDHVQSIDGFEVLVGALFAIEELHHAHAADVLLGEAVDACDRCPDPTIALAHTVAEDARDDEDYGENGEGQQGQPPVDAKHHDGHDRQREEVVDDSQNAAREHLVDRIHVGGETRDQTPDRIRVEEADVQSLHVAEDLAAQVEHDLLAGPLHQVSLNELEQIGRDLQTEIDQGELRDTVHRL